MYVAVCADVHIDLPDPPFYTITYHKLEAVEEDSLGRESAAPRRTGSLSGSGAHVASPHRPKQKLVKHEKQTTQNRLKKR